jgi:alpha-amylase
MGKLKLLFGLHCHQPVGNFEQVFQAAHENAYLPFLEVLAAHPRVKISLQYSGVLYDWFFKNQPDFLALLQKLVKRGQVEILAAGYYEPLFSLVPDEDKLGQLALTYDFVKEHFGLVPRGCWLPQSDWEPTLPKIFNQAGLEYVVLDEALFQAAGIAPKKLLGQYLTEEEGNPLAVLAVNQQLNELIPFSPVAKIIDCLKSLAKKTDDSAVVFFADGEKFGLPAGAKQKLYQENHLDQLFAAFTANQSWLQLSTMADYLEESVPLGRVYLSAAGKNNARYFLMQSDDANNLHKKMLHVSNKLRALSANKTIFGQKLHNDEVSLGKRELYQGQCGNVLLPENLSYNHLRHGVYQHLIKAERELEKISHGNKAFVELSISDINKDGQDEILVNNELLSLAIAPARGGTIYELDYKPKAFNLINVLGRAGLLVDHFLSPDATLAAFQRSGMGEISDFNTQAYLVMPRRRDDEVTLNLTGHGEVEGEPLKIEKNISLLAKQSLFTVDYEIVSQGDKPQKLWFALENNFNLLAGSAPDRYYEIKGRKIKAPSLASVGEETKISEIKLVDGWSGFTVLLNVSQPALLWRFPAEESRRAGKNEEKSFQGSVVIPSWKFTLNPGERWQVKITFKIEQ